MNELLGNHGCWEAAGHLRRFESFENRRGKLSGQGPRILDLCGKFLAKYLQKLLGIFLKKKHRSKIVALKRRKLERNDFERVCNDLYHAKMF